MTAMGLPPAACFSDCHLSAEPCSGSDNASPAWETSSPPDRRSGWFLETLRRKAGLKHNKRPRHVAWLGLWTAVFAAWTELGRWGNCEKLTIVHLISCQSTSSRTAYVHKVCFYGSVSVICASFWLPRATSALQGSVTQPNKHPYPGHTGHSPTKALPGKNCNPK